MDFIPVNLVGMDEVAETATVTLADAQETVTVNLWEIAGYVRVEDNHTEWKYALTGE